MLTTLSRIAFAPLHAAKLVVRAADDLNALAERARREPDPVDEVRERIDTVLRELATLTAAAHAVDRRGREIVDGGADLTDTAKELDRKLAVVVALLPQLESELQTVAETAEPLQGAAEGVGKLTRRLRRGSSS